MKKYIEFINESISSIIKIGTNQNLIDDVLYFKYDRMKHIYSKKEDSDKYTLEVTNFDKSYCSVVNDKISSIFLVSNNIIIEEIKWYEENSTLEFLNDFSYDKLEELGDSLELVTFIGDDDINNYYKYYSNVNYIWAQYFTDSEKINMNDAICKTLYNNREIIIVIKKIIKQK